MINLQENYRKLYDEKMKELLKQGLSQDSASRKANMYAVENNWKDAHSHQRQTSSRNMSKPKMR
jgi:hypothetical protein